MLLARDDGGEEARSAVLVATLIVGGRRQRTSEAEYSGLRQRSDGRPIQGACRGRPMRRRRVGSLHEGRGKGLRRKGRGETSECVAISEEADREWVKGTEACVRGDEGMRGRVVCRKSGEVASERPSTFERGKRRGVGAVDPASLRSGSQQRMERGSRAAPKGEGGRRGRRRQSRRDGSRR